MGFGKRATHPHQVFLGVPHLPPGISKTSQIDLYLKPHLPCVKVLPRDSEVLYELGQGLTSEHQGC